MRARVCRWHFDVISFIVNKNTRPLSPPLPHRLHQSKPHNNNMRWQNSFDEFLNLPLMHSTAQQEPKSNWVEESETELKIQSKGTTAGGMRETIEDVQSIFVIFIVKINNNSVIQINAFFIIFISFDLMWFDVISSGISSVREGLMPLNHHWLELMDELQYIWVKSPLLSMKARCLRCSTNIGLVCFDSSRRN